jgi:hypothetical protein
MVILVWFIGAAFTLGFYKTWMDEEFNKSLPQIGALPAIFLFVSWIFWTVMCIMAWPFLLGLQLKRIVDNRWNTKE